MNDDNVRLVLPSGNYAIVAQGNAHRYYYVNAGGGTSAILTGADVEALYADSIAGDGGRPLPEPARSRYGFGAPPRPDGKTCEPGCGLPAAHKGICVPKWFSDALEPFLK